MIKKIKKNKKIINKISDLKDFNTFNFIIVSARVKSDNLEFGKVIKKEHKINCIQLV